MSLTTAQLQTFKTAIQGDANVTAFLAAGDDGQISTYYNGLGAGSVWLPNISIGQLNTAIVWSEFMTLPVATQNAYIALIQGPIDATNANIRAGFSSIFAGKVSLTNLTTLAARTPTRFEALFTIANVSTVFGYVVSPADVVLALNS